MGNINQLLSVCAPTGDWTRNLLVYGTTVQPTEPLVPRLSFSYWFIRNSIYVSVILYVFCLYFDLGFGVFYCTALKNSEVIIINPFMPFPLYVLSWAFSTSRLYTYSPTYMFFQILSDKQCLCWALWSPWSVFFGLVASWHYSVPRVASRPGSCRSGALLSPRTWNCTPYSCANSPWKRASLSGLRSVTLIHLSTYF